MHLLVLSAFRPHRGRYRFSGRVSMHLLVLSAFRQADLPVEIVMHAGLNAPSGAQCFPTCTTRS